MKVSKKSLIVSIAVLCVCALSLSAASFAWFTSTKSAKIETINMHVDQRSMLEISIAGTDKWVSTLTPQMLFDADLYHIGAGAQDYTKLNDVSYNGSQFVKGDYSAENNSFNFTVGATQANKTLTDADYIKLPIKLRNPEAGTVIIESSTFAADKLQNALRVAVEMGGETTIYGKSEKGYFQQAATGVMYADMFDSTKNTNRVELSNYDVIGNFDKIEIPLAQEGDYYTASVTFYIYIEGSDEACVNENSGVDVSAAIGFKMK